MEGVLLLAGLAVCAIPFAIIYLVVAVSALKKRLGAAEAELALLSAGPLPAQHMRDDDAVRSEQVVPSAASPMVQTEIQMKPPQLRKPPPPVSPSERRRPFRALAMLHWLSANWFYVAAAVSLALAGIFLVQYGIENGLLPPRARVASALAFGAGLIGAGEYIRRRWGDGLDASTAYLPSVFSGAGIVAMFGALISARALYGLIGPEVALIGMAMVAVLALGLGWLHGALLAAIGVMGAFCAPFLVGGASEDPSWLYAYFALITALGLGIDTIRRWAWVSVLTLVLAYGAGLMLAIGSGAVLLGFGVYLAALVALSILIPARALIPDQSGAMIGEILFRRAEVWPSFPVALAFCCALASTGLLVLLSRAGQAEFWLCVVLLAGLAAVLILWSRSALALQDAAILPAFGLVLAAALQGHGHHDVWRTFDAAYKNSPEAAFPMAVSVLVVLAVILSSLMAWRGLRDGAYGALWGCAAAAFAPVMAIALEMTWHPANTIGAYPWALHGAVLAVFCTVLAGLFARIDGPEARLRASVATLAALASITFAIVLILTASALTLALVVMVVMAVVLDRRFDLPAMALFVSAGVVSVGYRLVADPGLLAALELPLWETLALYFGPVMGFGAAWWMGQTRARRAPQVMLETGFWLALGLALSLALHRWLTGLAEQSEASHWAMGLQASVWLMLMLVQLRRFGLGGALAPLRAGLAGLFGLIGGFALLGSVTVLNPLLDGFGGAVIGPALVNSLAVAWLIPAVILLLGAARITGMPGVLRMSFTALAVALMALWGFAAIRHGWQGSSAMALSNGFTQPELYSYTVALLLIGTILFYQSLARGHALLRRAGLLVIGLAVAKVFLVDISGLDGLVRVFSLLVLGLSLAGLAWLNRWAQRR